MGGQMITDGPDNSTQPLTQLQQTIVRRQTELHGNHADLAVKKSYTAELLAGGVDMIGQKVTEEAAEVVEAAGQPGVAGREHTIHEAADLLYHLLVLLAARHIGLEEVEAELAKRQGVSGLEEKASRMERA